jgi:pimeloyl-ACP methyl ester carboxylesterase
MSDPVLDHPVIAARYFFPRRDRPRAPFRVEVDGATLACSFHRAGPDAPTAVHFHGNGEVVADYLDGFADRLTALGWNLLLAEYRGYGASTGEPRLGAMLDDVEAVVRAAGAPPERLVLFGRSVGSIFALEGVARFPEAAGLVLESAVADPLERLLLRLEPEELGLSAGELAAACERRLDHRRKIGSYQGPVLVLHATHDDLVDASNARRLAAWAGGPVALHLFERGDHNSILAANEDAYFAALSDFAARL